MSSPEDDPGLAQSSWQKGKKEPRTSRGPGRQIRVGVRTLSQAKPRVLCFGNSAPFRNIDARQQKDADEEQGD